MTSAEHRRTVLGRLAVYAHRSLLARIRPDDFTRIPTRPFGALTRIYLSQAFTESPDLEIPTDLWLEWSWLARESELLQKRQVFDDGDWTCIEPLPGQSLSETEPRRLYGYRGDVLEIWSDVSKFADAVDTAASDALTRCQHSGSWDENGLSGELLFHLHERFGGGYQVQYPDGLISTFHFSGYKQSGIEETNRGDIGVVVVREDADYGFVGVSFIEAKKRDAASGKFESFSELQLCRILLHEPQALLALYDNDGAKYRSAAQVYKNHNRVALLPMSQVASNVRHIDKMCRFATTLGNQFAMRYANGADLRPCESAAEAVLRAQRAAYLVIVGFGTERFRESDQILKSLERFDRIEDAIHTIRSRRSDRSR